MRPWRVQEPISGRDRDIRDSWSAIVSLCPEFLCGLLAYLAPLLVGHISRSFGSEHFLRVKPGTAQPAVNSICLQPKTDERKVKRHEPKEYPRGQRAEYG